MSKSLPLAHSLALLAPAGLLGGALAFQHVGGLPPCEMCMWQRWPHFAALGFGLLAFLLPRQRALLVALAGVAILVSGGIGLYHAGVEQHWWEGLTRCSAMNVPDNSADFMRNLIASPLIRCDAIPWQMWGISLAGWNAILSTLCGGLVLWLTKR
jgi:disulfide bond formation protein DsbB